MKRGIAILAACGLLLTGFSGCGGMTAGTTAETTAIEALSPDEAEVFKYLKEHITNFYDPGSVKILDASDIDEDSQGIRTIYLKISGSNKAGGSVSHVYSLYLRDEDGYFMTKNELNEAILGDYYTYDDDAEWDYVSGTTIDIGNLNRAIHEYLVDTGLIIE